MTKREPLPDHQWQAAIRVLAGLLVLQTEKPGTISKEDLPNFLLMAAEERERQGDYGAAMILDEWAVLVTRPVEEWD